MANKELHNKIIRGTYGKIWVDGELFAHVKSFEAKASLNYESVDVNGKLGTYQRYTGHSVAGTIVLHKIDSGMAARLAVGARSGSMPEFKVVTSLADPDSVGAERVELLNVTFDELMLTKFENKKVGEESVPFKAADFNFLEMIV